MFSAALHVTSLVEDHAEDYALRIKRLLAPSMRRLLDITSVRLSVSVFVIVTGRVCALALIIALLYGGRFLFALLALPICIRLWKSSRTLSRRLRFWPSTTDRMRDRRPPVVYLRMFAQDVRPVIHEVLRDEVFSKIGPTITFGSPEDWIPRLGFPRVYINHADWQEVVTSWLARAGMIVIDTGGLCPETNLGWEMKWVLESVPPARLKILVSDERGYYMLLGQVPSLPDADDVLSGDKWPEMAVCPMPRVLIECDDGGIFRVRDLGPGCFERLEEALGVGSAKLPSYFRLPPKDLLELSDSSHSIIKRRLRAQIRALRNFKS